jgi:predicted transcriptional regulator
MRTTLDLDDDLVNALKPVAAAQNRSLGRLVSDIVRASMAARPTDGVRNGLPVFQVPNSASVFGPDDVARALDE